MKSSKNLADQINALEVPQLKSESLELIKTVEEEDETHLIITSIYKKS